MVFPELEDSLKSKIRVLKESFFCSEAYDQRCKEGAPFTDELDTAKEKVNWI